MKPDALARMEAYARELEERQRKALKIGHWHGNVRPPNINSHFGKLKPKDVFAIRAAYENGADMHEVAKRYGITRNAAMDVGKRKTWGWL